MNLHLDERTDSGFAFYIDGDLQFDSADEALYHEGLALPALSLAYRRRAGSSRTERGVRVLICGGGDGLAMRECLRFPGVESVDLVDLSPEVVAYGRTRFATLNGGAFDDPRVSVHIADAWEFLEHVHSPFDVIVCDFTVPRSAEESRVFTREWYARIRTALAVDGVAALNAVSPERTPEAFWCLRRTVRAAGMSALPLRICIPSFREQGYGAWGFLLTSPATLYRAELRAALENSPVTAAAIDLPRLWQAGRFPRAERIHEATVPIHEAASPCLVPLLLNPGRTMSAAGAAAEAAVSAPPALGSLLRAIPILHPYHTRMMVEEMAEQVAGVSVRCLDLKRLVNELLRRAAELPADIRVELIRLRDYLAAPNLPSLERWGDWAQRLLATLLLILTIANLVAPDNAFGKGAHGLGHASVSRAGGSFGFGRGSGFSESARAGGGSFGGGPSGYHASGGRTSAGSFGRSGRFSGGQSSEPHVSSVRASDFVPDEPITGHGFRSGYLHDEPTDIFGTTYSTRVFRYRTHFYPHTYGSGGYAQGYTASAAPGQPIQEQPARFVADDDMFVLDNGDVVVTLSDSAYLLVSGGAVTLMQQASPDPVLALFPDPALFDNITARLQGQRMGLDREIGYRQDWLSWVGWTARFSGTVAADAQELRSLQDLRSRIQIALSRLGSGPSVPPPPLPNGLTDGAVELFVDCGLLKDGRIALLRDDGVYVYTDGASLTAAGQPAQSLPPGLSTAIRSVLPKLLKETDADLQQDATDLAQLDKDRASLQKDLADYTALQNQNGPSYDVDYGTDEISAADAIARTNADLAQNAGDTRDTQLDQMRTQAQRERLAQAVARFVR